MAEIVAIVKDSWTVILFFLPGYAYSLLFRYCRGDSRAVSSNSVIVNVIVSILTVWAIQWIFGITDNFTLLAISMSILLVAAMLMAKVVDSAAYSRVLSRMFHLTGKLDFWRDVFDCDKGTLACIIQKDRRIIGYIHLCETGGENRWVSLSGYTVIDNEGDVMTEGDPYQEIVVKIGDDDLLCLGYRHNSDRLHEEEPSGEQKETPDQA